MSKSLSRGAFIVFEGCDRSGKTTQCKKLVETLKNEGHKTQFFRFPERDTTIGHMINAYLEKSEELEDHAVHMLFAANRWELVPQMRELLMGGTTLIVDRYSFSGVAFTSAKHGMDLEWCKSIEVGLPAPDAVVYLDLSEQEAAKRGQFGEERYEQTDFQKRVADNYRLLREHNWQVIDANKSVNDLHTELLDVVKSIIDSSRGKSIGQLWQTEGESASGEQQESAGEQNESSGEQGDLPPAKRKCSGGGESEAVNGGTAVATSGGDAENGAK